MPETPKLGLPLVQQAQAQKHVTVNESLVRLDSALHLTLIETDAVVPAIGAAEGDAYGVGAGASGEWTAQDGKVAVFANGGWVYMTPEVGWRAWSASAGAQVQHDGAGWALGAGAVSANGAGFVHQSVETDLAMSPGATVSAIGALPANAIVYGVTGRVLSDIGGATSLEVGVGGSSDRYGSGIGVTAGSWMRGVTGSPLAYYADSDLVLTASGGSFDGTGSIRLAVHFAELTIPRG